jgi:protein-S-isoprenylcysteine O-methyltransferase Ste14
MTSPPDPRVRDNDGVVVFPPAVFAAGLVAGYAAWWLWPVPVVPAEWSLAVRLVGAAGAAAGLLLMLAAVALFVRAGTTPTHWEPTTKVVSTGIYRYTRNPMYVGMALVQGGLALVGNALWPLLLLIPAIWIIRTQVIAREERYLMGKFADDYSAYQRRVRRWL